MSFFHKWLWTCGHFEWKFVKMKLLAVEKKNIELNIILFVRNRSEALNTTELTGRSDVNWYTIFHYFALRERITPKSVHNMHCIYGWFNRENIKIIKFCYTAGQKNKLQYCYQIP